MWFTLQLENSSLIAYQPDFVRFFIRDKKRAKRTAIQEIELQPLYSDAGSIITGQSSGEMLLAFPPFTIPKTNGTDNEAFVSRSDIADILNISLFTLTEWMKRGLPFHKQRGRVYFIRPEVVEYIKTKKIGPHKFSRWFSEIGK